MNIEQLRLQANQVAAAALAQAEEIFGKMKRTNNDAELAQLREVYAE